MSEPIRECKRYAAENVTDRQKKQGPDERCYKLDAHKVTEGNSNKSQCNEG